LAWAKLDAVVPLLLFVGQRYAPCCRSSAFRRHTSPALCFGDTLAAGTAAAARDAALPFGGVRARRLDLPYQRASGIAAERQTGR